MHIWKIISNDSNSLSKINKVSQTILEIYSPIITDVNVWELLALKEHKDVFEKNGFYFEFVNDDNSWTGNRIKLLTLPFSKNVTFNVDGKILLLIFYRF